MWFRRRRPLTTEERVARIIARNQAHASWLCYTNQIAELRFTDRIAVAVSSSGTW